MNNYLELNGGGASLVEGAQRLLEDDNIHLVVVRDLITKDLFSRIYRAKDQEQLFKEEIPELAQVGELVSSWWDVNGYSDYTISPVVRTGTIVKRNHNFQTHADQCVSFDGKHRYLGGLTISLGDGDKGRSFAQYFAKKLEVGRFMSATGQFNKNRYNYFTRSTHHLFRFAAQVRQNFGDAVLISQLPKPAVHKVKSYEDRSARLLDFPLYPKNGLDG